LLLLPQDRLLPASAAEDQVQVCLPQAGLQPVRAGKLRLLPDLLDRLAVPAQLRSLPLPAARPDCAAPRPKARAEIPRANARSARAVALPAGHARRAVIIWPLA